MILSVESRLRVNFRSCRRFIKSNYLQTAATVRQFHLKIDFMSRNQLVLDQNLCIKVVFFLLEPWPGLAHLRYKIRQEKRFWISLFGLVHKFRLFPGLIGVNLQIFSVHNGCFKQQVCVTDCLRPACTRKVNTISKSSWFINFYAHENILKFLI